MHQLAEVRIIAFTFLVEFLESLQKVDHVVLKGFARIHSQVCIILVVESVSILNFYPTVPRDIKLLYMNFR